MPVTPLHIGPALVIATLFAIEPIALVIGAMAPDIDGLFYLLGYGEDFHGMFHSIFGSIWLLIVIVPIAYLANLIIKKKRTPIELSVSAIIGIWSHILLDSMIYSDLNLLWPLDHFNPFAGTISYSLAVSICMIAGIIGIAAFILKIKKKR
jgi:membrane-bound metal-dependent hydrolase YbcI (DUF457 family)